MQAVVSGVAVPPLVDATSVATVTATMVVALTTAPRVATSATSNPALSNAANRASMPAKTVAVLMPPVATTVVVTALSSVAHLRTPGTRATAALLRAKMLAKTAHVKAAAGKIVVVTTGMPHVLPPAAQRVQVTSSPAAPSNLVPATSNRTLQAKALPASVAAPVC
jgi:hypothetical protein